MGYSLGANLLVKYLEEEGKRGYRPLAGAVSVSNPWNFEKNTVAAGKAKGILEAVLGKFYGLALTIGLRVRRLLLPKSCCRRSATGRAVAVLLALIRALLVVVVMMVVVVVVVVVVLLLFLLWCCRCW